MSSRSPSASACGTLASTCGAKPGRMERAAATNAATAMAETALIIRPPVIGPLRPVVGLVNCYPAPVSGCLREGRKWFRAPGVLFRRRSRTKHGRPALWGAASRQAVQDWRAEAGRGAACGATRAGVDGVMPRIALYPGSFDPVTNGHLHVVRQTLGPSDRLLVAVGVHSGKQPLFSTQERLDMTAAVFAPVASAARCALDCTTYDNLTVTPARQA